MTDVSMAAMDIALKLTDEALAKPEPEPYSDPDESVCRNCHAKVPNDEGEFFDDMFLCGECKCDGNALYRALRDMADCPSIAGAANECAGLHLYELTCHADTQEEFMASLTLLVPGFQELQERCESLNTAMVWALMSNVLSPWADGELRKIAGDAVNKQQRPQFIETAMA